MLTDITNMETENDVTKTNSEQTEEKTIEAYLLPDGIPKSPHLGKDFSPSGERIHNSMRARRRQRTLQAQHATSHHNDEERTDQVLQAVKDSLQLESNRGVRRKVDRGFVLDISRTGILNINNVRDLNNLSDFDSSCDTSLNYHEVNNMEDTTTTTTTNDVAAAAAVEVKDSTLKTIQETDDNVDGFKAKATTTARHTMPLKVQQTNPIISITQEEDTQAIDSLHHVQRNLCRKIVQKCP
ncbi:hypothetical protein DOY81_010989 [Sarcophaga bullata]|nr:hypothetical protein DOY81_010989 [Sarcophaga bullata]